MKRFKSICMMIIILCALLGFSLMTDTSARSQASIADKARTKLGCRYVFGACHSMSQVKNKHTRTFDCSGLVSWAAYQAGYNIGVRNTSTLRSVGKRVSIKNLKKGDILIFGKRKNPSHTGIYMGHNKFIHAPHTGSTVRIVTFSNYYRRRFIMARRLTSSTKTSHAKKKAISKKKKSKSKKKKSKAAKYKKGTYKMKQTMALRKKASKKSKWVGVISKGAKVKVKAVKNKKWAKVRYKGKTGYVSLRYAKKV
ncbi:MAG: C40 family peptidase [bacterium]